MKKIILTSMILISGIIFASAQNTSNNSVEQKSTKSCCSKGTAEAKSCSSKGTAEVRETSARGTAEVKSCCSKGTASTGSEKKCSTSEMKSCSGHGSSTENKAGNNPVNEEKKTKKVKSDE